MAKILKYMPKCVGVEPINVDQVSNVGEALPSTIPDAESTIYSNESMERVQTMLFAKSSNLNITIADCIHSNSIPFRLTNYQVPSNDSHHQICPKHLHHTDRSCHPGLLFDTTYNIYMAKVKSKIERDADLLGFAMYSDGATNDKRPTISLMAYAYNPEASCDVIYCSNHMAYGGIKDAQYLNSKYIQQ